MTKSVFGFTVAEHGTVKAPPLELLQDARLPLGNAKPNKPEVQADGRTSYRRSSSNKWCMLKHITKFCNISSMHNFSVPTVAKLCHAFEFCNISVHARLTRKHSHLPAPSKTIKLKAGKYQRDWRRRENRQVVQRGLKHEMREEGTEVLRVMTGVESRRDEL
ncbi:hypothetical protein RIF29_19042 [Crotalaria pallida]|uniref:Uncharacterized protein n=1 Tax=Crotalaria pallida TaxID=3830 RepID=A0AAN9F2M0_CROPI